MGREKMVDFLNQLAVYFQIRCSHWGVIILPFFGHAKSKILLHECPRF